MLSPMTHRPECDEDDWEDNNISNALAYTSTRLVPRWCKEDGHWTNSLVNYLWADCACCLFFRGTTIGLAFGLLLGLITGAILL